MSPLRLAERLKAETAALHVAVEGSVYMSSLMGGQLESAAYCALLRSLHPIYFALEAAIGRHEGHPLIAPVWQPALRRSLALQADLNVLYGADWADALVPVSQALAYAAHLREIGASEPGLLLAHAYVRYLGDLSGGQMLRRAVGQSLALADGRGVAFYDFGGADAMRALRHGFRAGLASLNPDINTADAVVEEATLAFQRHQRLFEELAQQQGLSRKSDQSEVVGQDGD